MSSYNPKSVEGKWYSFWESNGLFMANAKSGKEPFCIVIPPPNVTGVLHMGHALVDTLQDILIRWKRMQGYEALWVPGTDHAGIATQAVVERQLFAKTGKRRKDFSREAFLEHVWDWKEKSEDLILDQIRKLGCSCDWSRLRFTMDESLTKAVHSCFKKMYDDGLIYQGDYLVNWDPVTQTALSDDEVEHEEVDSSLWHIKYPFADGSGFVTVATTRPETMLGDTAVAIHPEDERYKASIGKEIRLPLSDRLIPLIGDGFVDPQFGTGVVKITPAHDFNDFEAGQRNELPMINILTPDARMNENAGAFVGLSVEEARTAVLAELKKQGWLVKTEPHKLRVGKSYRSKAVIQPYLSKQWFVRVTDFKEKLISAVKEKRVKLIPPHWEQTYFHWIENLRDWCISRQLWWGHRIPIWYNKEDPSDILCYAGEGKAPDPQKYVQDEDVLDTWFSSMLWPFSVLGWPEKTDDLKMFYPTSTLITGHDILFFWVARMIMAGEYVMGDVPFKETFLHGLIYGKSYWREDPEKGAMYLSAEEKRLYDRGEKDVPPDVHSRWEKMSKSKGNVIDPLAIIDEYGTDSLRIALTASCTQARQIDLDTRRFEEYKNFTNKLWNGARFVFMNLEGLTPSELAEGLNEKLFTLDDRWVLSVLNRTIAEMNHCLTEYTFDRAATRAYEFFWNDFCAIYVEMAKPVLQGGRPEEKKNKQKILVILLSNAMRLLHPIAPFITEEIFSTLKETFGGVHPSADLYTQETVKAFHAKACITAPYPTYVHKKDICAETEATFEYMNELVRTIRNLRAEMGISPGTKTELFITGKDTHRAQQNQAIILALTKTAKIEFTHEDPDVFGASHLVGHTKLTIPIPPEFRDQERGRLTKELEKARKLLEGTQEKLSNKNFREKAPLAVVEKLEHAARQTEHQIADIQGKLSQL
jgi:valyl-tRNA synthetase